MKAVFLTLALSVVPTFLLPAQVINFTNYSPAGETLNWNTAANWSPNTLLNYAVTIGGSGFAGFKLGTLLNVALLQITPCLLVTVL